MTYIDENKINEIVANNDIIEIIGSFITLIRKGQSYVAVCPFHDDTNPSLSIDSKKQIFKCFVCNTGGNVLRFVRLYNKWNLIESLKFLAEKAGIDFNENEYKNSNNLEQISEEDKKIYDILDRANSCFKSELIKSTNTAVKAFVEKRKLNFNICKTFDIGYDNTITFNQIFKDDLENNLNLLSQASLISLNTKNDFFKGRITFGIRDELNKIIGFSARALDNSKPKYINSAESKFFKKSNILYNLYNAFEASKSELIFTEGFFDVIALYKIDVKNVVCLMGTALTKNHVQKLKLVNKITLFLDGDEPGQNATYKTIINLLQLWKTNSKNIYIVNNQTEYDPDDLISNFGSNKLKEVLDNIISYEEFTFNYLCKKHGLNTFNDKKGMLNNLTDSVWNQFSKEFYPIWNKFDNETKEIYNNRVKEYYNKDLNLTLYKSTLKSLSYENIQEIGLNKYDEFQSSQPYFDDLVSSQNFNDAIPPIDFHTFDEAKIAKKSKYSNIQNWIEKLFILVIWHPDLLTHFKKRLNQKEFKTLDQQISDDAEMKPVYDYILNNDVYTIYKINELKEEIIKLQRHNFLETINLNNLSKEKKFSDFNELYKRALNFDQNRYANILLKHISNIESLEVKNEILEKIRQIKVKNTEDKND